jgi:hypothetical protein
MGDCLGAADCPPGHACTNLGQASVCMPPSLGAGGIGAACAGDPQACRSGLCLGVQGCTERCSVVRGVGQLCPPHWGCLPVDDGSGTGAQVLVCGPAGTGAIGASCTDNTSCWTGLCVTDTSGARYCTRFCHDGICATGFQCADVGATADGVALRACERI